eukprot:351086-Chlamydomonas_euryale.AAC.2
MQNCPQYRAAATSSFHTGAGMAAASGSSRNRTLALSPTPKYQHVLRSPPAHAEALPHTSHVPHLLAPHLLQDGHDLADLFHALVSHKDARVVELDLWGRGGEGAEVGQTWAVGAVAEGARIVELDLWGRGWEGAEIEQAWAVGAVGKRAQWALIQRGLYFNHDMHPHLHTFSNIPTPPAHLHALLVVDKLWRDEAAVNVHALLYLDKRLRGRAVLD